MCVLVGWCNGRKTKDEQNKGALRQNIQRDIHKRKGIAQSNEYYIKG